MHSAAPAIPRGFRRGEQRAQARHLRVAEVARRRRRVRAAVWVSALLTAIALFVLVSFHVLAVQHAFAIDRLSEQKHTEELRYERLRAEVATLSSPPIVDAAKRMGMQAPQTVDYIDARRLLLPRRAGSHVEHAGRRPRRGEEEPDPSHRPPPRPAGATSRPPRPPRPTGSTRTARPPRAGRPVARAPRAKRIRPPRAAHPLRRLGFCTVLVVVVFGLLSLRVTQLQVLSGDHYRAMALAQRLRTIPLSAERGSIFDRDGRDSAISVDRTTVYADPTLVPDPALYAPKLAPVVGVAQQTLYDRLADKSPVRLHRTVDDSVAKQVKHLGLAGVAFVPEPLRQYPSGSSGRRSSAESAPRARSRRPRVAVRQAAPGHTG
jgi:hypothetical protein